MTTYIFKPTIATQYVNWDDPTVWTDGVVPNASDADVVFPHVTTSDGATYSSSIAINGGETFLAHSVLLQDDSLGLGGALTISAGLTINSGTIDLSGTTLAAATIDNGGSIAGFGHSQINTGTFSNSGTIAPGPFQPIGPVSDLTITAGTFTNNGLLAAYSNSGTLTVTAAHFTNTGTLTGEGSVILNVDPGGFTNLSGGVLTGGTYIADAAGGVLSLNVGAVIATDAANVTLADGGVIQIFDPAMGKYVPLTTSLHDIAPTGMLVLYNGTYAFGALIISGELRMGPTSSVATPYGNTLLSDDLTIAPGGLLEGIGTVGSAIENNGMIVSGFIEGPDNSANIGGGTLILKGQVTGSGSLQIEQGQHNRPSTLDLEADVSETVTFSNDVGLLIIGKTSGFTGAIAPVGSGDQILLKDIDFDSVLGKSYSGDSQGGVLTIQETGGISVSLNVIGSYTAANFVLSSEPGALSSDPTTLLITVDSPIHQHGDFNDDERTDLAWQNTSGEAVVWLMDGITWSAVGLGNQGAAWHIKTTGDLNGDGKADILWQSDDGTAVVSFMNGGTATSYVGLGNPGLAWQIQASADFNNDGKDDILWQNADGTVVVALMNGSTLTASEGLGNPGANWHIKATGDFNGDGHGDILFQNSDGTVVVWQMHSDAAPSALGLGNPGPSWHVEAAGDFDGDGTSDILWQNDDGTAVIWFMKNGAATSASGIGNPGAGWHIKSTGDTNGDGKADITWQSDDGNAAVWLMNGAAIAGHVNFGNPGASWHVVTG